MDDYRSLVFEGERLDVFEDEVARLVADCVPVYRAYQGALAAADYSGVLHGAVGPFVVCEVDGVGCGYVFGMESEMLGPEVYTETASESGVAHHGVHLAIGDQATVVEVCRADGEPFVI